LGETLLKKCSPPNPLPKTSNIELGRGAKHAFDLYEKRLAFDLYEKRLVT
jgi:hypothetical protein